MVEPIMYFAIGFMVSTLVGLAILPLVHNRAVRLTAKRLEAATPVSMAEIQADKDHLRAEFAMSARRLEMNVEQLKAKATSQLAELGKKSDIINRMKYELGEKNATIFQLEARERAAKDALKATEAEFAAKTELLRDAEARLSEKQAELVRLNHELSSRSQLADTRQVELGAVHGQIAALQERVNQADQEFNETRARLTQQTNDVTQATRDLDQERARNLRLTQNVVELEAQLSARTKEAENQFARASDFESRLAVQSKMMTERGVENQKLRQQIDALQAQINQQLANAGASDSAALQKIRAEKTALEQQLAALQDDYRKLQHELSALRQQGETSWASERMENAVLRERINDVAAEVAKLAMTLEGPDSPIEALLESDRSSDAPEAGRIAALSPANGNQPVPATKPQPLPGKGTLADRIRALQSQASRAQA